MLSSGVLIFQYVPFVLRIHDERITRMHSSRMSTVRCSSRLLGRGGVSAGGVCPGGVCQGVSARAVSAGGCLPGAVCQGSVWPGSRGVCPGGVVYQGCTPPVNRMTDACENITLSKLRCVR